MRQGNRIILNTLATYGQSVVALVLGLLSARWTLMALGTSDFGIFGVVGSIIILVSFLNGGLSVGVVRFLSFSIGQGAKLERQEASQDLSKWFNTALSIHLLLPVLVVIVGWPIGEYAIRHWLTIPPGRLDACLWTFRFSLFTAFVSIFSVPYTAMFRAHQQMVELALIEIVKSVAICGLAWSLLRVDADRLVVYAASMTVIASGGQVVQILRATWLFPECRLRKEYLYNAEYLKRMFGFVGWKMFGMGCVTMRQQGTPIMVNLAFGPTVNAAYSIANRLSTQATSLSSSLLAAFQPAVTSAEGKGDRRGMLAMAIQVCNFGTLLISLFAIPLLLKMDSLLRIWLVEPPAHTATICRWLLGMFIIDKMTSGPMIGVNARGKISLYELIQGPMFLLALPAMWLLFRVGFGPEAIGYALFGSHLAYCISRVVLARYLIGFPVKEWMVQTVFPLASTIGAAATLGFITSSGLKGDLVGLVVAGATTSMVVLPMGWFWVLDCEERSYAQGLFEKARTRFNMKTAPR